MRLREPRASLHPAEQRDCSGEWRYCGERPRGCSLAVTAVCVERDGVTMALSTARLFLAIAGGGLLLDACSATTISGRSFATPSTGTSTGSTTTGGKIATTSGTA